MTSVRPVKVSYIYACALPGIGEWKEWSPENIEKIVKKRKIEKLNPTFTPHTQFTKQWTMPILNKENEQDPIQGESVESMFHTGTANPHQKLNVQQMHEELLRRTELGEIEESDIPKVSTITNWISTFSRKWKEAMALRSLEEKTNSKNS
uniref:Uncharacterized protein n=2 Tax=Rhizophagus irregularis TaxID=588596 RepID=U9UV31_RHIID